MHRLLNLADRESRRRKRCASFLCALFLCCVTLHAQPLPLTKAGVGLPIVTSSSPSPVDQFAAGELARYLAKMTGATFSVHPSGKTPAQAIVLGRAQVELIDPGFSTQQLGDDGFILRRSGGRILIAGAGDRGTLYGVYELLEKLGCRWFAPNFAFYGAATGELVPHIAHPVVAELNIAQRPSFKWRKLYIEEGRSHTPQELKQMVDWMAKARMNVLDCPIDYQHQHHTEWDNFREALIPELRKRGILIEVGGHGYPNFLPPEKYFAAHPDWFGMRDHKRTADPRVVFSTANKDAVDTFVSNISSYLRAHPEIDVLDVWPPDSAVWSEAPEDLALGSPSERQILLLSYVLQQLQPGFPKLKLQFIAYETYTVPPLAHQPSPGIFMDFCPINRSFEDPLYASSNPQSQEYFHNLQSWLDGVMSPSEISIYSYITKYAWRSLPILIPHLIVDEIRRFHQMGVGGFATYSEPGNWATFELDHYIVARALWDSQLNVAHELEDYTSHRYGSAGPAVLSYLQIVEDVAPHATGIPGTQLTIEKQQQMLHDFAPAAAFLRQAHALSAGDPAVQLLLVKLDHSDQYLQSEMNLRLALLVNAQAGGHGRLSDLSDLLADQTRIINTSPNDGVILHSTRTSQK